MRDGGEAAAHFGDFGENEFAQLLGNSFKRNIELAGEYLRRPVRHGLRFHSPRATFREVGLSTLDGG